MHGYGSSPMPWRDLVLVAGDNPGTGFLAAVERDSGQIAWRVPKRSNQSFGTPIAGPVAGREQLIIAGPFRVFSYDPATAKMLWWCEGPTEVAANTAVLGEDHVYVTAGWPKRKLMCIRADGSGDVTDTHVTWEFQNRREAGYVPSLLLVEDRLYLVNDEGLLMCFDAKTGDEHWREKLDTAFSSSPVLADGRIYVIDESGVGWVYRDTKEKFDLLAKNDMQDPGFATPVMLGDKIYLRTGTKLWCLIGP
jgi:hypothetical protein